MIFYSMEQFGERNFKGIGDPLKILKTDIPFSSFDGTDISTVQPYFIGKTFLTEIGLQS